MAKKVKKLSRKELLKEDDFLVTLKGYFTVFLENRKYVYFGIGSLVAVTVLIVGTNTIMNARQAKSSSLFSLALESYHSPVVMDDNDPKYKGMMTFENESDKYESAADRFDSLIDKFPGSQQGRLAMFYAGNCYYNLGEFAKAAERFSRYLEVVGEDQTHAFVGLALESLGYSHEAEGNLEKALEAFSRLGNLADNKSFQERGLTNAARIYEQRDEPQKALEIYKRLAEEFTTSRNAAKTKSKLARLEAGS